MRIQPRKHLLEIWRATIASSLSPEGEWVWSGRDRSDSVSDAEQLLCLMLPATELHGFRLDVPAETDAEVLATLQGLGDAVEIPRRVARISLDYLKRYTLDDGYTPSFAGGRLTAMNQDESEGVTPGQLGLDVVVSYALSVSLTLSMIGFARVLRQSVTRNDLLAELDELQARAELRLTAAMVGLLRSFCVHVFPADSTYGEQLLRAMNQSGTTRRRLVNELRWALRANAAGLREANIGIEAVGGLDDDAALFEYGWSWGLVLRAPEVEVDGGAGIQRSGYAHAYPYLYFTAVALDSIADLFSERTRILGLLDEEQQRLARALQLRWDLTQQYWATLATFGDGRWPVEDIPWHTIDGVESEYLSLLITSIVVRTIGYGGADADLSRMGRILTELGVRGRVTRRPLEFDPAVKMHYPGFALELDGAEAFGPRLAWSAVDYSPQLLKRILRVAGMISNNIELRDGLLILVDELWQHLLARRIGAGPSRDLWDQPGQHFPTLPTFDQPSWHYTFRVTECLVATANLVATEPLRSEPLTGHALHLLAEAEHLYAQELFAGSGDAPTLIKHLESLGGQLEAGRDLLREHPAQATAVLIGVLQELHVLTAARSGR